MSTFTKVFAQLQAVEDRHAIMQLKAMMDDSPYKDNFTITANCDIILYLRGNYGEQDKNWIVDRAMENKIKDFQIKIVNKNKYLFGRRNG